MLRVILPLATALFVGSTALGADMIDLKMALQPGHSWSFEQVNEVLQTSSMTSDTQPPYQAEQRMRAVRKGTITILQADSGIPTSLKVAFDRDCTTKMKSGGQEQSFEYPFAGQTITLTRDVKGQVTSDFKGNADPMSVGELNTYLMSSNSGFAGKPVAVGQQWEPDTAQMRQMYQLGAQDKIVAVAKLASIADVSGRRAAEVVNYVSITKTEGGLQMVNTLKGTLWYDIQTGNLLASSVDGTTTAKGTQQMTDPTGQAMRVNIDNSGRSELRLQTKPIDLGSGAGVAASAAPPASGGGIAGLYKGEKLTVELSGSAGQYTGWVALGDQKYPMTCTESGGHIKGTFKSGNDSFDFTATLTGNTLTLQSGGGTYTMQKQRPAAPNPLAQPANPLGGSSAPHGMPAGSPATGSIPAPDIELAQFVMPDPYLKCVALTFVAPAKWKMEGGVWWTGTLTPPPAYNFSMTVRPPENDREFRLFPLFSFMQTNNPILANGNEVAAVMTPTQFMLHVILPRCRPEARDVKLLSEEKLPGMAKETFELTRRRGLPGADTLQYEAGRIHVEYQMASQRFEEMIYCVIVAAPMPGGGVGWGNDITFGYGALKGKLEASMAALGTIGSSLKPSPQWMDLRWRELQRIVAASSRPPQTASGGISILDVSRSMARDQDSFIKGLNQSAAARDRVFEISRGNVMGTQRMNDPTSGEVLDVQTGYLNYYRDYYGVVHGSNLTATDFYTTYKMNVTQLQPGAGRP